MDSMVVLTGLGFLDEAPLGQSLQQGRRQRHRDERAGGLE